MGVHGLDSQSVCHSVNPRKYWAQEKTGVREGDTRGERELPHPSRVSLARARSLFRPLLPSAYYAGYHGRVDNFSGVKNHMASIVTVLTVVHKLLHSIHSPV